MKPNVTASPLLGEHTDEVLAELGYSAEQIAAVHEAKAV
jgi:formyl-CoA transferase